MKTFQFMLLTKLAFCWINEDLPTFSELEGVGQLYKYYCGRYEMSAFWLEIKVSTSSYNFLIFRLKVVV